MAAIAVVSMTSCEDDDTPQIINEEEVITTVTYTLTNAVDNTDEVILRSVDADGDGPLDPVETVSKAFTAGASYNGEVRFENELESPAENITLEVIAEGDEHEVFYNSTVAGVVVSKTDVDADGNPLGVTSTLTTGAAGTGTLTIVLRHEPTKPNNGTLSDAGGETDVQVSFDVTVQ
ncbi:hypothetical protein DDD_2235 [Nonlabens dokdonensis DSW-6]|uniref:Type 1 periplasmic binding fold superfamily protein n=2 Tax=Nonlabens dokdonensis TaxID=328515 RepID=L7WAZ9_NONDD|nr:hypothetical protein DDD_2235 [Nonlabens dokdonensis DSW-6]